MSYVLNMVGGGSGGGGGPSSSDAILTVTVPTGSTVTMTKGGITLTPTMWVQAADNTLDCALFVIAPSLFDAVNAWTVTATLSGDTANDTVTIDSNEQYDLKLSYWNGELYIEGNQYQIATGGWGATLNPQNVSFKRDHIQFTGTAVIATELEIDVTEFNSLKAIVNSSNAGYAANIKIGIANSRLTAENDYLFVAYAQKTGTGSATINLDVSGQTGSFFVCHTSYNMTFNTTRIWLE